MAKKAGDSTQGAPLDVASLLQDPNPEERIKGVSFEDGLRLLEELVTSVENGDLALNQAVTSYERGVALIGHLRTVLSNAEEKLKLLRLPAQ